MPSLTVENYLKAILQIEQQDGNPLVAPGRLASQLSLAPGTVTSMLKTLADSKLVRYTPYEGVRLTSAGRTLAVRVVRRHRLIELFLVQTLDLSWDQVHEEAEAMEHAVSDFLVDRIDEFLGFPEADPHGSPIPSADGDLPETPESTVSLSVCNVGTTVRFVRVISQQPRFLRFLTDSGFELGGTGVVFENNKDAGVITIQLDEQSLSIGRDAADSIQVECVAERQTKENG